MNAVDSAHPAWTHAAMSTRFRVVLLHSDRRYAGQAAEAAFAELDRLERRLSRFVEESDVSRINRLAVGQSTTVDPDTFDCLRIAERIRGETDGIFDVAYRSAGRGCENGTGSGSRMSGACPIFEREMGLAPDHGRPAMLRITDVRCLSHFPRFDGCRASLSLTRGKTASSGSGIRLVRGSGRNRQRIRLRPPERATQGLGTGRCTSGRRHQHPAGPGRPARSIRLGIDDRLGSAARPLDARPRCHQCVGDGGPRQPSGRSANRPGGIAAPPSLGRGPVRSRRGRTFDGFFADDGGGNPGVLPTASSHFRLAARPPRRRTARVAYLTKRRPSRKP
jgi:hypothetical protein